MSSYFDIKRYDTIQQEYYRKAVRNVVETITNLDKKLRTDFSPFFLLLGNKYAAAKREIMDLASIFTPRLFGRNSGFHTGLFDQNSFHFSR